MTAPAAMPSREQVEAEILPMTYEGADLTECVERVLALFAPILAEKERRDALDREQAETVRFLQHHLDNPQPPSEALKKLFADYQAAGVQSVGLDSPFNACCYRDHCKALEARALAAEAALAGERERCARIVDEHARELMVYRDHQYVAKHLQSAATAIRAQGE